MGVMAAVCAAGAVWAAVTTLEVTVEGQAQALICGSAFARSPEVDRLVNGRPAAGVGVQVLPAPVYQAIDQCEGSRQRNGVVTVVAGVGAVLLAGGAVVGHTRMSRPAAS